MSCLRAAHTTASIGVLTSSRSQIVRSRRRKVRALSSSLRAATSAVTPLAIWASNRISSSLSPKSSVPRRASVAVSTPSSLVRGDDRGDAAVRCTGTGWTSICTRVGLPGPDPSGLRSSVSFSVSRAWPEVAAWPIAGVYGGTPGDDSLVGLPRETGCDRQPSARPFSPKPPVLAVNEDRESFQATLRLGTLGGRIRPVKRRSRALRARSLTMCDRAFGAPPCQTPLPGKTPMERDEERVATDQYS